MENTESTAQNPEFAERFKEGDWVTGIGEHVGTSQVFKYGEILEPFSYLQSDDPDDFRIALDTEIAEARAKVGIIPIGDLSAVVQANALWVFTTPGKLQVFLDAMAIQARNAIHTTTTGVGRAQIASDAHAVSKVKVRIEEMGKSLVTDWKAMAKVVDNGRKLVRDFCDDLRDEIRDPLTQYEAGIKAAQEEVARLKEINDAHPSAILDNMEFDRLADEAKTALEAKKREHDDKVAADAVETERKRVAEEVAKPHKHDIEADLHSQEASALHQTHSSSGHNLDYDTFAKKEMGVSNSDAIIEELDGIPIAHSEARKDLIVGGLSAEMADQVIFLVSEGRVRNIKFTETV